MKLLVLDTKNPYVNLAIEEYLFENSKDDIFILWQNEPTVVIGKNQNAFLEINSDVAEEKNIKIARRITGGGAVYHDLGNVNYTVISENCGRGIDFAFFSSPIIDALRSLGLNVSLSGRNDILIEGKKVSGNAEHTKAGRTLHHGTLLFSSELDVLSDVLRPDPYKLKSKAIKSTRSRVANIREFLENPKTAEEFILYLKDFVKSNYNAEEILPPSFVLISALVKRNESKDWIYPERDFVASYTVNKKKRYDFGTVNAILDMKNDIMADVHIHGDFFGFRPISELEALMKGKSRKEICALINSLDSFDYVFGMTASEFVDFLFDT